MPEGGQETDPGLDQAHNLKFAFYLLYHGHYLKIKRQLQAADQALSWVEYRDVPSPPPLDAYEKGLIPFIAYLIAHESHHRGNAIVTLKQSGVKVSDKLKWGLWEWDK